MMDHEQDICLHVVHALKRGLIPSSGLDRIAVGREAQVEQLQRNLEFSRQGGAWVQCLSGDYGVGKTFLCSLLREQAWQAGFVVAAIDLNRDAPFHRFEVIYHRLMENMRSNDFRDIPAFEFIVQEWLFGLEKEVQRSIASPVLHPERRSAIGKIVTQHISEHLTRLRIYESSFASALRGYYGAVLQGNEIVASAAIGWLKGDPNVPADLRAECNIRGNVDRHNIFNFLQAIAALVVHIGYAGLIVIFDEAEFIRGIARPDNRHAAYENLRLLVDKTTQGELGHCGFVLAGTEDLFTDKLQGIASHHALYDALKSRQYPRRTGASPQPLMALTGFDQGTLLEVARRVRQVHGMAHGWDARERLPDEPLRRLIEETAARCGEKFTTVPRGFLKGFVDLLDKLAQSPQASTTAILAAGIDPNDIEEVEREEAHLLTHV